MKLNLGAADRAIEGFLSVDRMMPADIIADLEAVWPWPDSSVDGIMALDVIEHIGDLKETHIHGAESVEKCVELMKSICAVRHTLGRIHVMNELHRVLIPGGRVLIETPNAARGVGYLQDPTHVSPWCMSTFKYFEHGSFAHTRLARLYGITAAFRILEMSESPSPAEGYGEQVWKIRCVLEAVK